MIADEHLVAQRIYKLLQTTATAGCFLARSRGCCHEGIKWADCALRGDSFYHKENIYMLPQIMTEE